jgi:hypothetical protein
VAEHRVDQVAARKQPVPRPLTEPAVLPRPRPEGAAAHRKLLRRGPDRWRRRMKSLVRTKRGRWTLVGLACALALIVGLLASGFLSSPAPAVSPPGAAAGGSDLGLTPSPIPSSSPATHHKPGSKQSGLVQNPVNQLRQALPDNPLNHLNRALLHNVRISASAPGHMAVLGYLVPTGLGAAYGAVHTNSHSWSMSEQALGKGYLAAVFIQTGRSGIPITCTVTVDGRVTSRETASSPYGRAVCIG